MSLFVDLPPGMDPRDPRFQRILQQAVNQYSQSTLPPKEMLDNEDYANMLKAQTAAIVADIRQVDSRLFLEALKEIRLAMMNASIAEGDKGSTDRPPIQQSFDEVNAGKLQEAYLNIVLRYVKYIDTICERDLQFNPPNSVSDKAKKKAKKP